MYINTDYVSYNYSKQDYINLGLSINSDEEIFNRAINIFIDRIQSRFLDQINILSIDYYKNAFSIMALECLLIETFAQFYNGLKDTKRVSKTKYVDFLINNLHCFPSEKVAKDFYDNIRCGILHQAQTKSNSALTFNSQRAIELRNNVLMVSVDRFKEEIDTCFENYCTKLRDVNEVNIRQNFINKMNFICNRRV